MPRTYLRQIKTGKYVFPKQISSPEPPRRAYARGGWGKNLSLELDITETLLPAQRRLIVIAYILLVNFPTSCRYHGKKLHANLKEHCKWAKK